MESEFKFKIGDLVYMKCGINDCLVGLRVNTPKMPITFMVCERVSQECPGGVQLHYKLDQGESVLEETLVSATDPSLDDLFDRLAAYIASDRRERSREAIKRASGADPGS